MGTWISWLALAALCVVLEMFSGTFYLLMVAVGFVAGAVVAWMGGDMMVQFPAAAAVAILATLILRTVRGRAAQTARTHAERDPNMNLDIGQMVDIDAWQTLPGQRHRARTRYRGTEWDVEAAPGVEPQPGAFRIREIRGNCLIVTH